ncbi:MAG: membrane protein insertase YidC [Actinobacteria bacterium]|nr:membrane protein insertase YidC [Actinomycetota bacterium]
MFDLIAKVLAWFYDLWPSFGMAIVLLTLVVMVILTPLTLKGTRSMIKMQHLQPEMKKIQNRYKGDRERMNKEMMAFYQANSINPMGGCIPMVAQAPVFIVLYNVLRGLTRRRSDVGEVAGWVAGRLSGGHELIEAPVTAQPFYPDYLPEDSRLFLDLSEKTEMVSWGFDLSRSLSQALGSGLVASIPYLLLILAVFATSWVMNKQIRGRNKGQSTNPQQEMIMKVMPFFLPVISYGLDAALVSYFVVSNVYRTGQQFYITRALYGPGHEAPAVVVPAPIDRPDEKPKGGKGKKTGSTGEAGASGSRPSGNSGDGSGGGTGPSDARSRRTTAGSSNAAGDSGNDKPAKPRYKKADDKKADLPPDGKKGRNAKPDKPKADKSGRRQKRIRRAKTEESDTGDGRPPAARRGGGRTTPSGTARARGAKRKNRKKRK